MFQCSLNYTQKCRNQAELWFGRVLDMTTRLSATFISRWAHVRILHNSILLTVAFHKLNAVESIFALSLLAFC
jgi:hypothetical protein